MVATNALVHVHGELNRLSRSELGDKDIRVHWRNGILTTKVLFLLACGHKDNVPGVNMSVLVCLEGILLAGRGIGVHSAGDIELEADGVVIEASGVGVLARLGLFMPLEEVLEAIAATLEGNKT